MARGVHVRVAPKGLEVIAIWSGSIPAIPGGWVLETRLEDLFVRGIATADGADLLATGGADSTTLAHTHDWPGAPFGPGVSDPESAHAHSGSFGTSTLAGAITGAGGFDPSGGDHAHNTTGATTATYDHRHFIEGKTDADSFTVDNRPPYLALAYIRGKAEIPPGAVALYAHPPASLLAFVAGPRTALAADVGPTDTAWALTVDPGIPRRSTAFVGAEQVAIFAVAGTDWLAVVRGWNGTTPAAHAAGSAITFPKYAICDGLSGTPQLRDSFVIGADGDYLIGGAYGTNDFGLAPPAHAHTLGGVASQVTAHAHGVIVIGSTIGAPSATVPSAFSFGFSLGSTHTHDIVDVDLPASGEHAHGLLDVAGTPDATWGHPPPSIPKYVRLYSIQRVVY